MKETEIVKACLHYLKLKGVYAWRNNTVGIFSKKSGGYFFHGLRGVADILGIVPQQCPCALQGVLLAIEVKKPGNRPTNDQSAFLGQIKERGGISMVVHSVDELKEELDRFL